MRVEDIKVGEWYFSRDVGRVLQVTKVGDTDSDGSYIWVKYGIIEEIQLLAANLEPFKEWAVKVVRQWAVEHYNESAWDQVVECWEDEDIISAVGGAVTRRGAINNVSRVLAPRAEQRDAVLAEIF